AGSLLQVAGASVDDSVGAAHRVPTGATVAGAATARNLRPLLWGGHRTLLYRGPAWGRSESAGSLGPQPPAGRRWSG
ncbi:unnamed protein product, partial [Gulo gulo]